MHLMSTGSQWLLIVFTVIPCIRCRHKKSWVGAADDAFPGRSIKGNSRQYQVITGSNFALIRLLACKREKSLLLAREMALNFKFQSSNSSLQAS